MPFAPNIMIAELPVGQEYDDLAYEAAVLLAREIHGSPDIISEQVIQNTERDIMDNIKLDGHCFVAIDSDANVVGACTVNIFNSGAYISELGVISEKQNQGIGSDLIAAAEGLAKEHKRDVLSLAPVSARGFYEKLGFNIYEIDDEVEAKKVL